MYISCTLSGIDKMDQCLLVPYIGIVHGRLTNGNKRPDMPSRSLQEKRRGNYDNLLSVLPSSNRPGSILAKMSSEYSACCLFWQWSWNVAFIYFWILWFGGMIPNIPRSLLLITDSKNQCINFKSFLILRY